MLLRPFMEREERDDGNKSEFLAWEFGIGMGRDGKGWEKGVCLEKAQDTIFLRLGGVLNLGWTGMREGLGLIVMNG